MMDQKVTDKEDKINSDIAKREINELLKLISSDLKQYKILTISRQELVDSEQISIEYRIKFLS